MTSPPANRLAQLLELILTTANDDRQVEAELTELETSRNPTILRGCHQARHFMADRDLHGSDSTYMQRQRSLIESLIAELRG